MVGINKNKWIFQTKITVFIQSLNQVLIVVIDKILTIFIVSPTQNSMRQRVPIRLDFSSIKNEVLLVLRSIDTIKHHIQIT